MTKAICERPVYVGNGQLARCRQCKICLQHKANTWILRCLMEAETSVETWAVTLTYAPGHAGADFYLYSDVQKFMKRLRRDGHAFRYLVVGETGSRSTKRVHYHAIIFWQSPPPALPPSIGRSTGGYIRRNWERWGHGHVVIDPKIDFRTVRYVVKYMHKTLNNPTIVRMSLRPAIGATWIAAEALRRATNNCPTPYNRFVVQGFKHSLPPLWWKRYQTAVEDHFERAGRLLHMDHEAWHDSNSTRGHALKKALTEWTPLAFASRAVVVDMHIPGAIHAQFAMLAQTQRGIALYVPPEEDENSWRYHSSASLLDLAEPWEGWAEGPIPSHRLPVPSGVYPLDLWQVRRVLRGHLPQLTRDQLTHQWAYLPDAFFKASPERLKEATGAASSSGRRYAIPLLVGKFYGRALAGRP